MKTKLKNIKKRINRPIRAVLSQLNSNKTPIKKTVGPIGCDFKSIRSAIEWASSKGNFKNRITLYIKNGIYSEGNLTLDKDLLEFIEIVGESKDGVIIKADGTKTPEVALRKRAGLFAATNCNVSNLTLDVNDVKYCVHNDQDIGSYEALFTNCKFIHRGCADNSFYFPIGIGARRKQNNIFIDCEFEYRNSFESPAYGIFWHNWNNQKDSAELKVVRGKFINCGIANLSDLGSTQKDKCIFDECTSDLLDKGIFISATAKYYKPIRFSKPVSDVSLVPYNIDIITRGTNTVIAADPVSRPLMLNEEKFTLATTE